MLQTQHVDLPKNGHHSQSKPSTTSIPNIYSVEDIDCYQPSTSNPFMATVPEYLRCGSIQSGAYETIAENDNIYEEMDYSALGAFSAQDNLSFDTAVQDSVSGGDYGYNNRTSTFAPSHQPTSSKTETLGFSTYASNTPSKDPFSDDVGQYNLSWSIYELEIIIFVHCIFAVV